MALYLPIRALNRSSNIRIDNQKISATATSYINLSNAGVPKDFASHSSIGQVYVVGALTNTNSDIVVSGLVVTADGSDLVLTAASGTLKTRSTGATVISVGGTTTLATADGTHPRIDLVSVNNTTGAITHVTGTPAVSPVAPAALTGTTAVAKVAVATSATSVSQANVTDVAPR